MRDVCPRSVAPLALAFALAALTVTFLACQPTGAGATAAQVETTPVTIEPDDANTIPCGPRRVLQNVCQRCHRKPPVNGAPFPLLTRSNIVRVGPDGEIRELMIEEMEVGRMPLAPVTIDYDSRETLLDWLHAGAPAEAPHGCEEPTPPEDPASDASTDGASPTDGGDAGLDGSDEDSSSDASASD